MNEPVPTVTNAFNPLMQPIETQMNVSVKPCAAAPPLSLLQNFSWTLFGNLAYTGCQWAVIIVLAKLGSPILVGQFALGLAVTAPFFIFLNMQLRAVQVTDARAQFKFGDYLGLRLATIFIALNLVFILLFAMHSSLQTKLVIMFLALAKASESLTDIFFGLMQRRDRMDRIAKSMIIKGVASVAAVGVAVYYTRSAIWAAVALGLAWTAILLAYDIPNGTWVARSSPRFPSEALRPRWDRKTMYLLARMALPLGVVVMLIALNSSIVRYFVQGYLGERQLGIFAALAYLQGAAATIEDAIAQSALPHLSRSYASKDGGDFRALLLRLLVIGVSLGVCGVSIAIAAGRPILTIFYGPEYAAHVTVFVWIMIAIALNFPASFMLYAATAAQYFRSQLPVSLVVTIGTLLASAWFIPRYGILGAAYTLLVAALLRSALALVLLTRVLRRLSAYEIVSRCCEVPGFPQ
jgi:O-antigen/teichoic acid export membrane protein